ncbi:MAG: Rha family transcriptional regulator [Synergistaceae bacterium]|nr:Rha family transcriptional regulator [Synergistaceae bacterium]
MKELIPMNDYGIFANVDYEPMVDSRFVADVFEKNHQHVMESIRNLLDDKSGYSLEFRQSNFRQSSYVNAQNKKQPCYIMTRDGFTALVMGFTGKKANYFKERYIKRFNEMEEQIKCIQSLREQHPQLTEAIKSVHENPQFYHYSNEMDMLNRLVLGMTAKEYREKHNIPKSEPIRSYFTPAQAELMKLLQNFDIGFVIAIPDFQQRKQMLEYQAMKWREKNNEVCLSMDNLTVAVNDIPL